jgi:hypothetical protein
MQFTRAQDGAGQSARDERKQARLLQSSTLSHRSVSGPMNQVPPVPDNATEPPDAASRGMIAAS